MRQPSSNLNQKAYEHIETWRSRKLTGEYAYVYVDGIYLKRSWGGEVQNVSVLVAIGVSTDGYREIIGAAEGMKEDFESWHNSFIWLKERGLTGVRLIVGDKCLGMLESIADVFPEAKYQRCTVKISALHSTFLSECLQRSPSRQDAGSILNAESHPLPRGRMREVSLMLKAIHAQENKEAAREKAASVVAKLREMKLSTAAKKVEDGVDETLTYMDFPTEHWTRIRTNNVTDWTRIRTNNVTERVNREIKRRTKAIGAFPDGQSALMLVCARLRHVAASDWGTKRYLNMDHLFQMELMNNTETAEASTG